MGAKNGWRYIATRLNGDGTETLLDGNLDIEVSNIEDVLSGDNMLSGTMTPALAKDKVDGAPLIQEWSTAIYAEHSGDIRGGGIVQSASPNGALLEIECAGFTSYPRDMPWTGSRPYVNNPPGWNVPAGKDGSGNGVRIDPIDAVRVIWRQLQEAPGGNLGLVLAGTKSGKQIGTERKSTEFDPASGVDYSYEQGPFTLNWYSSHDLGGIIDDLASQTPFDYHERHYWIDDDTIGHRLDIGYPKIGRRRDDLRFVFGENIFDPLATERRGEEYATGVLMLGAGDGSTDDARTAIHTIHEPPRVGKGLRRIAVVSDDRLTTRAAVLTRAQQEYAWRSRLGDIESVMVRDHEHARLGAAQVGDEIFLQGPSDWTEVGLWVRILSISVDPSVGTMAEYHVARTDRIVQ